MELTMQKGIDTDGFDFYNVDLNTAFQILEIVDKIITDIPTLKRLLRVYSFLPSIIASASRFCEA